MNDLRGYRDSDLLAMLEQMEQMQAELTEKTQTIQALESELQQLPTLSEWQNVQVLMQEQTTQLQEQSLKIRRQAEHIAKQNESDRILKDNERLRLENEELTDKADAALRKQKQAEQDAAYARSHMKIKEVEVERKVLYEKCKNCKQSLLDKKITNYRKRKAYLENYLFLFMMLCTTTMILTAFQQEAFWKDTVDFFTTFLNGCGEVLEMIADAECRLAQLLADMISQPIWSNVVYWIALALLFIITGILLLFICHMAWDKYRKKVRSGINMWTVSIAILLMMVVVYLGDYIRMILPMNLFLLWLIGLGVLLVAGIYVAECNKYRY